MTVTAAQSDPKFAFRPLKQPANLTSTLVARLREEITSGRLAPGVRLPTEQEMMTSFGVSRTVIREAVAALKADGLVMTRQGSGAFVATDLGRRPFRIDPDQLDSIHDVMHLMELRASVELEAAGLAAERRQEENLSEIDSALQEIDRAIAAGDAAIAEDFAFHSAIARATHNPYHLKFLEFLGNFTIPRQRIRIEVQSAEEQVEYLNKVQAEHREVFAAIEAQDAGAAREAARRHCMNSRSRYQKIAEAV
ncbi:MAG: FadR/GntR family transcriptional regulator [Alphaproteobacteria bacterium]